MRFQVHHFSRYEYTVPVSLCEHTLRLLPQLPEDAIEYQRLSIEPTPSLERVLVDPNGNRVLRAEFLGSATLFSIESEFAATVSAPAPATDPGWPTLPWFGFVESVPRTGAIWSAPGGALAPNVNAFAQRTAQDAGYRALYFVELLTRTLFYQIHRHIRVEGEAQTSAQTLSTLRGACRDITVLFLDCCLALGIGGRFVSGYQSAADTPYAQRQLHAWPELYLPGLGWRGWDATHGVAVSDGHLALAAAGTQAETMPVEGGYYFSGPSVSSTLSYGLSIQTS